MPRFKTAEGIFNIPENLKDSFLKKHPDAQEIDEKTGRVKPPYKMEEGYTPTGAKELNKYLDMYGEEKISENASKDEIKAAAGRLQNKIISTNPDLVSDYMLNRSHQPNKKISAILGSKGYGKKDQYGQWQASKDDLLQAYKKGDISINDIKQGYKDDQWWYRALKTNVKKVSRKEYEEKMKDPSGIAQGEYKYFNDPYELNLYTRYEPIDEDGKPTTTPDKITTPGPGPSPGPGTTVTTTVDDKKKKTEGDVPGIKTQKVGYKTVEQRAPWWLQDIVGVAGAFGDLNRIKRYPPWQATPNVHLPGATFYDPTRELAANAEQANIQTQGLAAFTGPQALSARSAQIQGQALKNAADVMGRYNNLNVGLANELEQNRANILNTASQNQANLDTQLWDKYTIMNQQFDNSKAQARQELRKHYINAITNRAKTQALNTLYPNFQVLPETGGYVEITDPNYTPTYTGESDGTTEKQLWKQASEIDPANTFNIWRELMRTKYNNKSSQYPYQGYEGES
jgi:hypothetical protein